VTAAARVPFGRTQALPEHRRTLEQFVSVVPEIINRGGAAAGEGKHADGHPFRLLRRWGFTLLPEGRCQVDKARYQVLNDAWSRARSRWHDTDDTARRCRHDALVAACGAFASRCGTGLIHDECAASGGTVAALDACKAQWALAESTGLATRMHAAAGATGGPVATTADWVRGCFAAHGAELGAAPFWEGLRAALELQLASPASRVVWELRDGSIHEGVPGSCAEACVILLSLALRAEAGPVQPDDEAAGAAGAADTGPAKPAAAGAAPTVVSAGGVSPHVSRLGESTAAFGPAPAPGRRRWTLPETLSDARIRAVLRAMPPPRRRLALPAGEASVDAARHRANREGELDPAPDTLASLFCCAVM